MQPAPLVLTGATGRVATLLRPALPGATWLSRGAEAGAVAGHAALVALGGVTSGDAAALDGNRAAALWALEAARAYGVPRVLLASSAAVYGRSAGPCRAEAAPSPANAYGAAKAAMEAAATEWVARHPDGPRVTVLRLGNVAGADALFGNLTPGAVPVIDVWPDGATPRRSYIGPLALARVLQALAAAPDLPPVLNVAAPGTVAMGDLATAAGHAWTKAPAPPGALRALQLDTGPLQARVPLPAAAATAAGLVAEWRTATA